MVFLMLAAVVELATAQVPPRHFQVEFERDLYQDRDLSLQGVSAIQTVDFPLPRRWELTDDPVLTVYFGHSNTLLEDRSTLTLRLNDQGLGSVGLGPLNATDGRMEVRIPRHLLRDHNSLSMLVDQHYTRDCEDPFDPSLWTRISRLSTIDFSYESVPIIGDLRDFPYPFFDRQGYGPLRLTLVHPGPVSATTAEAAGLLTYALGRLVDYRGVELRPPVPTLDLAGSPALLIGTPEEVPELAAYVADLPAEGEAGLLAITTNPADASLPVLVV
ncbi:MAG TPA: cellulose biosynthesis cyclic di-GMP-binding regulatory protein BcsB, partial [Myxococcota bacterium]|nr:cellulose biosynthesis cyclic di-GMP-binding regulatory protein BcsB [Myxococcota bacterium]